jgi:hypothetical protein
MFVDVGVESVEIGDLENLGEAVDWTIIGHNSFEKSYKISLTLEIRG